MARPLGPQYPLGGHDLFLGGLESVCWGNLGTLTALLRHLQ